MIAERRPHLARGAGIVLVLLAASLTAYLSTHLTAVSGERSVAWLGASLVAVAVASLAVVWWRPLLGIMICAVALGTYLTLHYPYGPILGAGLLGVFLVSWRSDRRRAIAAVVLLDVAVLVSWLFGDRAGVLVLLYLGWSLAAAAVGDALRSRQRVREEQQARAALLEQTRQNEALRAVAEQRLEIARDLHDGVAHAMTTINVQAAAAARVMDRRPESARSAFVAIAQASATVLDELNAVVTVLRDDDRAADRMPTPGLADIAALVAESRRNGLECDLQLRADPAEVSSPLGTAAYRIVQESLTNVLRHSGADRVEVSVVGSECGGLVVEVRDDGRGTAAPGPASPGAGRGIAGMRERATATGGGLIAGPDDGGFVVRAEWAGRTA